MADRRRYGVIETRFRRHGEVACYWLTIDGEVWACVEWSPSRRRWCIQDASGRCLAHCDAIHGQDVDAATAVRLAKRMIVDGRMPTPEEAERQLQERLEADRRARRPAPKKRERKKNNGTKVKKAKVDLGMPMEILSAFLASRQPTSIKAIQSYLSRKSAAK
jgi:hypothetical protein